MTKHNGVQRKFLVRFDLDQKLNEMKKYYDLELVVLVREAFELGLPIIWERYLEHRLHDLKIFKEADQRELSITALKAAKTISALIVLQMIEKDLIIDELPFYIEGDISQERLEEIIEGAVPTQDELYLLTSFLPQSLEELEKIAYPKNGEIHTKNGV